MIQTPSTMVGKYLTPEGEGAEGWGLAPPPKIARAEAYIGGHPTPRLTSLQHLPPAQPFSEGSSLR